MALRADRVFSDISPVMEHSGYGRWRSRIPQFIHSGNTNLHKTEDRSRLLHVLGTKDSDGQRTASKKTVTMAPMSMYMTSRSLYTARKPLTTTEHQISILKNPFSEECSEKAHGSSVEIIHKETKELVSKQSNKCTAEISGIHQVTASFSESNEDLDDSLSMSDLRLGSSHEDPEFISVPSCQYERWSPSSQPLDDLTLTVPLSLRWTSTQQTLPFSRSSQNTKEIEQDRDVHLNPGPSVSYNKGYSSELQCMSPCQANYWACAIPDSLPPSPNRKSPTWDPDKEYQDLLDYTYPIRPKTSRALGSTKYRSLLQSDPLLQDSGIDLDPFCSASSLSCLDQSGTRTRHANEGSSSGQYSSEFHNLNYKELSHSKSSDTRLSSSLYSSLDQVGLSVESLNYERKQNLLTYREHAPNFIRTTRVLARPGSFEDEEFLRLPEQLQELQELSHQLRDITAQISQPVTASWESLARESASVRSSAEHEVSTVQEEKSIPEIPPNDDNLSEGIEIISAKVDMIGNQVNNSSLNQEQDISEKLCETLSAFQTKTGTYQLEEEPSHSLLQQIQVFCSNLEELIRWLYKVVEKIQVICPPSVNIDSVKASLADYKSFQRDVQEHQPLTASVLQTGEILLCSMNSASPFLKDTLMLIERQSHVLETHSEHLLSSILSVMDHLTEPCPQAATERTS